MYISHALATIQKPLTTICGTGDTQIEKKHNCDLQLFITSPELVEQVMSVCFYLEMGFKQTSFNYITNLRKLYLV
ncbi:MAG: hypothetical protein EPN82_16350 [Bacteroidetes bacterium]|nr:MAG: hypothetical protein EPN82_16350 [Bacteroidota bacterium]